jgi:hypothetical protein
MSIGRSIKNHLPINTTWDLPYILPDSPFNSMIFYRREGGGSEWLNSDSRPLHGIGYSPGGSTACQTVAVTGCIMRKPWQGWICRGKDSTPEYTYTAHHSKKIESRNCMWKALIGLKHVLYTRVKRLLRGWYCKYVLSTTAQGFSRVIQYNHIRDTWQISLYRIEHVMNTRHKSL